MPTVFELPTLPRTKPDNGRWDFPGGHGGVLPPFLVLARFFLLGQTAGLALGTLAMAACVTLGLRCGG